MYGKLAIEFGKRWLPLEVCRSNAGYYIGTMLNGVPFGRESVEYWATWTEANNALKNKTFTQRTTP